MACEVTLKDGYHVPTFIIDDGEEVVFAQVEGLASTAHERRRQMLLLGGDVAAVCRVKRVRNVFFIAEGWMTRPSTSSWPKLPPSRDPDRTEVLTISGLAVATAKVQTALFEMLRDQDGILHDLLDLGVSENDQVQADSPLLLAFVDGLYSGSTGN